MIFEQIAISIASSTGSASMAVAFSVKNGAIPVIHPVPNMTSPYAIGMRAARTHQRSSPILNPKPSRFRWKKSRVATAATAGHHIRRKITCRRIPESTANCGFAMIRSQNIEESANVRRR